MRGGWSSPTPYTPMDGKNKAITTTKKKKKKKKKKKNFLYPYHVVFSYAEFFRNQLFEKFFQEYRQSVNSFDSDQTLCFVGPNLVPNCLQKLSADDKSRQRFNRPYYILIMLFCRLLNFFESTFRKILSGIPSHCQTVWIQIRPYILSGPIWSQTVCKNYQQTTKVGTD